jgi:cyclase
MLKPRIIPCLLIHDAGLVKTVKFSNPVYVGDPLNAVKIFNEKSVDEIIVADIDATKLGKEPNYALIEKIAIECRMPFCYAGGITTSYQVEKIISLGVEKVAIGTSAVLNTKIINESARRVGNQSIVVVLDVIRNIKNNEYEIVTHSGSNYTGISPFELARQVEQLGAGEILINSIDNDGTMQGYDFELVEKIRQNVRLPITVLGGASSLNDIQELINKFNIIGAAAGSIFVFKGKYKAVLIQYPSSKEKESIFYKN